MTNQELESFVDLIKKVALEKKINIFSFLQKDLQLELKNPHLHRELIDHINQTISKGFKKLETKADKLSVLHAYNVINQYNSILGEFYLNEIFLAKDPSMFKNRGHWINKWYMYNVPMQGT